MRARRLLGVVGAAASLLVPVGVAADAAPADGDVVPGAYIVTVVDGVSPEAVASDHGRRLGASVDHVYRHAARGYAARMPAAAAARAAADPRVRTVVADRVVRISAPKGGSGGGSAKEEVPTGVTRVAGGLAAGVPVAVIDTGIDLAHPDLTVAGYGVNCSTGNSYADGNGHGTHVAGTIGAIDNEIGVVGVAPGTTLVPVRVLNNAGSGTWSSVICGVDWVVASDIVVANMSLGGTGAPGSCTDGGLRQAICDAVLGGVTVVVAAGNESENVSGHVPASFPEAITVSALADSDGVFQPSAPWKATCRSDREDTFADFSNFGTTVDLIAPGVCIKSTWKGGGYKTISGTSMAAPHVAGAAATYVAESGVSDPTLVEQALKTAGTLEWDHIDDPDRLQEKLVRVDSTW